MNIQDPQTQRYVIAVLVLVGVAVVKLLGWL